MIDRFVEGSYSHAERRIHEMEAVVQMLKEKDLQPLMSAASRDNLEKLLNKVKKK